MIRLEPAIAIQQQWAKLQKALRWIFLNCVTNFFFFFFVVDFFFKTFHKFGSNRIGDKKKKNNFARSSVFRGRPEPFPNITSIGNTSSLLSIAICSAVPRAKALSPDFPPFVLHLPPHNSPSLLTLASSQVSFSNFCRARPHLFALSFCREDTTNPLYMHLRHFLQHYYVRPT